MWGSLPLRLPKLQISNSSCASANVKINNVSAIPGTKVSWQTGQIKTLLSEYNVVWLCFTEGLGKKDGREYSMRNRKDTVVWWICIWTQLWWIRTSSALLLPTWLEGGIFRPQLNIIQSSTEQCHPDVNLRSSILHQPTFYSHASPNQPFPPAQKLHAIQSYLGSQTQTNLRLTPNTLYPFLPLV